MITPSHNPGRLPHLSTLTEMIFPQYCLRTTAFGSPALLIDTTLVVSDIQVTSHTAALKLGIPFLRRLKLASVSHRLTITS
jgi:hypothetical protein